MARSIVLPLYDHTSEDEIAEIMSELSRMGLDNALLVHARAPEEDLADVRPIRGERADVGALRRGAHVLRARGAEIHAEELDAIRWTILARETSEAPASPSSGAEVERPLRMAAIDQEGKRTDRELVGESVRVADREEDPDRVVRLQALPAAVDRVFRAVELDRARRVELVRPPSFRDHAEEIGYHRSIEILRLASEPIDGRPGWRIAKDGREWYAEEWL